MKSNFKSTPLRTEKAPSSTVRTITPPPVFVDPDRLHEAVLQLMRTRTAMIEACDQADAAAYAAGTPVRTQSFRAHIDAVTTEIRLIECRIAEVAATERAERPSAIGKVTNTLAQQSTDTLGKVPGSQSTQAVAKGIMRGQPFARLGVTERSGTSPHTSDSSLRAVHHDKANDDLQGGISAVFASAKNLAAPKARVTAKTTFFEIPSLAVAIRKILKDGGFGTDRVTNGELKQIVELFKNADPAGLNQCIFDLSDVELKLIAADMDSSGFGNYDGLSSKEKEAFIANLATKLDATQFARVAAAFDDPKQIASVLALTKNCWPAKQGFLNYCKSAFDTRNRNTNFSAADAELTAAAQVLASLSPTQLGAFLVERANSHEFLRGVFRLAQGQMLVPSTSGRVDCTYDPELVLTIAQLALDLPARSTERFLVFQLTVESLVNMKATQTFGSGTDKELLTVVKLLLEPSPLAVLSDHKSDPFLFTDYFLLLAQAGQMNVCRKIITALKGSTKAEDVMMIGFIVGLIENVESALSKQREQRIEFASAIAGALINAFEPWVVVAGALALAVANSVTAYLDRGTSISEAAFAATVGRFNDKPVMLQLLSTGRELARIKN